MACLMSKNGLAGKSSNKALVRTQTRPRFVSPLRESMDYEKSDEFVFLLENGEFAIPVKVENHGSKCTSFRSAPKSVNKLGTNWAENEVEVSEPNMIEDVLRKNRRTRCVSPSKPKPSLKGPKSRDVKAVYILHK